jgi:hypothetical protein
MIVDLSYAVRSQQKHFFSHSPLNMKAIPVLFYRDIIIIIINPRLEGYMFDNFLS